MAWAKMRFRDQDVWVRVDAAGRPAVDGSGRAEMKYRETDEKSYRPSASNLTPIAGAEGTPRDLAEPARRGARRASKTLALPDAVPGAFDVWTDGASMGGMPVSLKRASLPDPGALRSRVRRAGRLAPAPD